TAASATPDARRGRRDRRNISFSVELVEVARGRGVVRRAGSFAAAAAGLLALAHDFLGQLRGLTRLGDALESAGGSAVDAGLGDDEIHRDVVRLRMYRRHARELVAHADLERLRRGRGERPVEIAAAVAEP